MKEILQFRRAGDAASGDNAASIDLATYTHRTLWGVEIQPEQYQRIEMLLTAADFLHLRPLLRDADWLLAARGTLAITFPAHLERQFHLETFRVLGKRYEISVKVASLLAAKLSSRVPCSANAAGWTIAVMSGGGNETRLERIFDSVRGNNFPDVEVLIVGPQPKCILPPFARHVEFREPEIDARVPICAKKNLVAEAARHDKLLIIHDRIALHDNWLAAVARLRPDWDTLCFPTEIAGAPHRRLADWCRYDSDSLETFHLRRATRYFESYPADYRNLRHWNLDYTSYSPFLMLNGGGFAIKRDVFRDVPYPEFLHWWEIEDGHWSTQLINAGKVVSLAEGAILVGLNDGRYQGQRESGWSRIRHSLRLALRRRAYSGLQSALDWLNREQDLFTKSGVISRSIRSIATPDFPTLTALDWRSLEGILIRGVFERTCDIRSILEAVRITVPLKKRVFLEIAHFGFRFFKRSEHLRNCESLLYETAVCLKDDFIVRSLFCSRQNSYLIDLERVAPPPTARISELDVLLPAASHGAGIGAQLSAQAPFPVRLVEHPREFSKKEDSAVLICSEPAQLPDLEIWHDAYCKYGNVSDRAALQRLQATLLIDRRLFLTAAAGYPFEWSYAFAQVFEHNLILYGFCPHIIAAS